MKLKYAHAWLLEMNNSFKLHDYTYNMKAKITIFNIKGKENIWWGDVKSVRDIRTKELSWNQFKRFFMQKYLLERYYEGKAKVFYEINMGSMTNEEYMTKFLELLRCVLYIKDEKDKVQRFSSGLPLAFREPIYHDES